ncbi:MAG TPA: LLM class flavin-dependent oxidoreductase [Stellaceae bacterium]|nr:LLM class flavin-dependent oxidoreductase [Stellaceae bacterium]
MAHELRFLAMDLPNRPWSELLRRYQHIEALGFDLAGVADHFVDWTGAPGPWFEAWTLLAAVARETTTVRLATWVTQFPLRNPALLARQALTVDHISDGRLELGLGIGLTTDPSCEMMGIPNWNAKERVARFKEYVEIVDRLMSNEVTTYKGKFYEVDGAVIDPRPVQQPRPPIIIGAMGPVMLKCAARFADTWNSGLSGASTFDAALVETRDRIRLVDEHCAVIGRDPASLRRSCLMSVRERLRGGMFGCYESAEVFADMMQRLIDLGISEVGIWYPVRDEQLPVFEKIAAEVIPALKEKHAARTRHRRGT